MAITPKQCSHLRGLGHHLTPVVHIGKGGLSDGLVEAIDQALLSHELVKVRINQNATLERKQAAAELAERTESEVAQILGTVVLLYRRHPDEPKIFVTR